ncbi:MAG: winged helix-turn-helix domain-containing protein [Sulfuritalea sp.]|nr:winged helix-turn-helix domain-containing protein [Sulfuritalea sp.]
MALALFGKTRLAALSALFGEPGRALHLRQIAREGDVPPSAMARELDALVTVGIVEEARQANLRLFRANPASPLTAPLRELIAAMRSTAPAEPSAQAAPGAAATRKSRQLGLSAPFDWSNPQISDDALIAKTAASLRFEDVARLCAHYGIDRVRAIVASRIADPLPRAILERQLRNIEAAGVDLIDGRAA